MEAVANIYENSAASAQRSTTTEMAATRQMQEVQAQVFMAKKFPRNEVESYNRIINACRRKGLAEKAMYEYPRGGQKVTGPSIRLAEAMAQNWGNMEFGHIELERKNGESQVMAFAWDLETNTRQSRVFSVPHIRSTKKGNVLLSDPRDIYEMVANQAARRVRACIIGIIPGDVQEDAIEQCVKTLVDGEKEPIVDRVRRMSKVFEDEYSVTLKMIEKYLGCSAEAFSENDFIRLKNVYRSLRDGMAKREDYFDIAPVSGDSSITNPFDEKSSESNGVEKGACK